MVGSVLTPESANESADKETMDHLFGETKSKNRIKRFACAVIMIILTAQGDLSERGGSSI